MSFATSDQAMPVKSAEQRPDGHGTDICSLLPKFFSRPPNLHKPPQLLIARAAQMGFSYGHRLFIAQPRITQGAVGAGNSGRTYPHGFNISITMAPVATVGMRGV